MSTKHTGRWTGRNDKYGRPIMEGDTVISEGFLHVPHTIASTQLGWCVKRIEGTNSFMVTENTWENMEVIESLINKATQP